MNSFWGNLYDTFKDRRYGTLFLSVLLFIFLGFLGLLKCGAIFGEPGSGKYFGDILAGIGLLALTWGFLTFRRAQARRWEKLRHPSLSRDELRVARSKLRNGIKPINRPAPRAPDTFLKY